MTFKKIFILVVVLFFAFPMWAQVDESSGSDLLDWAVQNLVFIMGTAVIFTVSFALYKSMKTIWLAQNVTALESGGMNHDKAVKTAKRKSFVKYIYQELSGGVPLEEEKDILLNHDYDGIQELDNNLPPWWVGMFYVTILYAVIYIGVVHFSDFGQSSAEEYEQEVREAEIAIAAFNAKQAEEKADAISVENVKVLADDKSLAAGKVTFDKYCVACHGKFGEGMENMGQNLTDDYWIHGGGIENVFKIVSNGVPGKTMIPWKTALTPLEIQQVSSYILTLKGTNPPNAREPEGDLWEE